MEIVTREIALQRGLKRYYTDEPCKHGHVEGRYTRNKRCVVCSQEAVERHKANPNKKKFSTPPRTEDRRAYHKEYWKKYYAENRERLMEKQKLRYARLKAEGAIPHDPVKSRKRWLEQQYKIGGYDYLLKRERVRINREEREKARKRGDIRYDTGIACKHGHHSPRLVSTGKCIECCKVPNEVAYARNKEWRERNPDRYRDYMREYHRRQRSKPKPKSKW